MSLVSSRKNMLPYDQFDEEIEDLIQRGLTNRQVLEELLQQRPHLAREAAQVLLRIQVIERAMRSS